MKLDGGTGMCSSIMPYYTIPYGQDPSGKNVANDFSRYIITDLLREKYNYDGVLCTDWGITADNTQVHRMNGKPWGVADLSVAQRHFEVLYAGVDQFGGNDEMGPVVEAYNIWCEKFGKDSADARFRQSAIRLLLNFFRVGVFENPYLVPEQTVATMACEEFVAEGYDAQLKSIVMVKNHEKVLPAAKGMKVYMPQRHYPSSIPFFGRETAKRGPKSKASRNGFSICGIWTFFPKRGCFFITPIWRFTRLPSCWCAFFMRWIFRTNRSAM
jgi:beta-glucosidase